MRRPTLKQRRFAQEYVNNKGNATKAIFDSGYNVMSYNAGQVMGSQNLLKPIVWNMIESFAPSSARNIQVLANKAKNESVKLQANKDILDRAGFSPVTKSINENITINIDDSRFNEIMSTYAKPNKPSK